MEQHPQTLSVVKKSSSLKGIVFILFALLTVMTYLFFSTRKELVLIKDPNAQAEYAQKLSKEAVEDLKKYVVLAEGEEPVLLSVVSDKEVFKQQQAFFANVENGDQIFVFQKSSRALIWRPDSKKLVNFGVLDMQQNTTDAPQVKTAVTTEKVTKTATSTKK